MRIFVALFTVLAVLICGCGKDNPAKPTSVQPAAILLSRLTVSMVPGGCDTVIVYAHNANGSPSQCAVSSSAPGVATAAIADSTIVITGIAFGTATITITNANGKSSTLPVLVYNHRILDTGELLITYTDSFVCTISQGVFFWMPVGPEGFYALGGYIAELDSPNPNGIRGAMVVKAKPGSDALIMSDSMLQGTLDLIWRAWAPPGYKAMGLVWADASPESLACIREDLTVAGDYGAIIFGGSQYEAFGLHWIAQPDAGYHEGAYLAPGTFAILFGDTSSNWQYVNVLKVDLPLLEEAPAQEFTPTLTGYTSPADATPPTLARAMLVPCTILRDTNYVDDIGWQAENSPFYRLERQVYYKLLYFNYNQTSQVQTNSFTITSGISSTESNKIWQETAISLSAEAGLNFKAFAGKVTATVSKKFGYETQTSVTQLQQKSVSTSINTAPNKAAALWQQYDKYVLYRHNGTKLEPVSSWEVGIDSYVTDEYPD